MNGNEFLRRLKVVAKMRGLTLVIDSRQGKGSHQTILFGDKRTTIRHLPDELKSGTLNAMCKQLGIRKEEL
ncbi:MAG: type II toxin-antitoxin system HicA family toxin [Gammaproteobacteria bacterium]|nr:MAG: type II toxin-antitoxin system HicA family toxin [Gammaproteobacteria bacterium]